MFRAVHKKIARSISALPLPNIKRYNKWIEPAGVQSQTIGHIEVGTLTIYFGLPNLVISNNLCLEITNSIIESSVNVYEDSEQVVISYHNTIDDDYRELNISKGVLDNLLPKVPYIFEINSRLIDIPDIYEYRESEVNYYNDIIDFTSQFIFNDIQYSNNLFVPFDSRGIDGANYGSKNIQQELNFGDDKPPEGSIVDGVRKSYTVKKTRTSTHVQ